MSKQSSVCSACGEDNAPDSTFCLNCGAKMAINTVTTPDTTEREESMDEKRKKQLQSIPGLVAVIIFLFFIDFVGDGNQSIEWAYWPAVPIFLFAIVVPYLSLRIGE
ncbi:MAG: zinc-ribbon domain-containing protein [Candidatus Kariarchaeaceae archaeon]|jgi:uncharacterized membrane protein YvbJ